MSRMIITTPDNFLFLDVTDIAYELFGKEELLSWDGTRESLIDDTDDISTAISNDWKVVIPVGHLPLIKFRKAKKKLINGFWYVKYSDLI